MLSYRLRARDSTMQYAAAMVYFAGEYTVLERYKEHVCSLFPATYTEYNNLCKKTQKRAGFSCKARWYYM